MEVNGQRHAPAALFHGNNLGIHAARGCVGPRVGLDVSERTTYCPWDVDERWCSFGTLLLTRRIKLLPASLG